MQVRHTSSKTSVVRTLKRDEVTPEQGSWWFVASNEAKPFFCYNCGKFQFYRQHRVLAFVQDDLSQVLGTPPISPQCSRCGTVFNIHAII